MKDFFIRELIMKNNKVEFIEVPEGFEIDQTADDRPTLFAVGLDREKISQGRIQPTLDLLNKVEKRKRKGHAAVSFNFSGYDRDPREVYQIPEIRNWVARLYKNKPHLFYFLTGMEGNMANILWCLCENEIVDARFDPVSGRDQVAVRLINGKEWVEKVTASAVSYSKKIKDSILEQYQVADYIMQSLNYDQLSANSDDYGGAMDEQRRTGESGPDLFYR